MEGEGIKKKKKREGTDPIQNDCIYQCRFLKTVSGHRNTNTKCYIRDSSVGRKNKKPKQDKAGALSASVSTVAQTEDSPTTRAIFCKDHDTRVQESSVTTL